MPFSKRARLAGLVALYLVAGSSGSEPLSAQLAIGADPGSAVRTRAELEALLAEYELALASPAYSESVKRGIRVEAEHVRSRLTYGDFRVGDRIVLYVQGEPELPDTLTVEPGPQVSLPLMGPIPLAGVLRSEIEPHMREAVSRFIRDPVVRANGLMRLAIIGQIARPGFYTIPAETVLGEALMLAGGPTTASNLGGVRIERGATLLLEGEAVQEAMRNGLTLDQLNLQAGDQIVVPERSSRNVFTSVLAVVGAIGSITFLILRLSGNRL
jgi:hypothetical protein